MNVIFLGLLTSDVIHIISTSEFDTSQYVQGLCTSTQINSTDSGLVLHTYPILAVLNKQNMLISTDKMLSERIYRRKMFPERISTRREE